MVNFWLRYNYFLGGINMVFWNYLCIGINDNVKLYKINSRFRIFVLLVIMMVLF